MINIIELGGGGSGSGGGASAFTDLTDKTTADLPTINVPLSTALASKVAGAASSTDNAIVRFDGTTGKLVQNSTATLSDTGTLTVAGNAGIGSMSPTGLLQVGAGSGTNSADPAINVNRVLVGAGNSHCFSDSSTFNKDVGTAYNSFDSRIDITGENNYDHYAGFQFAPAYGSTGTITDIYGLYTSMAASAGVVNNYFGVFAANPTGVGTINNNYGVFINTLTKGTNNWSVYTGSAPSLFGGNVLLHNPLGAVGSGQTIYFTSGAAKAPQAALTHAIQSASRGDLKLRVRTSSTAGNAGLSDLVTINGGGTGGVVIAGTNALSTAGALNVTDNTTASLLYARNDGNVGIGTTSPTAKLDINSDIIRIRAQKTPASSSAAGNQGDICWDADYIYVCAGTNQWKRTALTTW